MALSHRSGLTAGGGEVLSGLAALGAVSCGVDTAEDGRRVWAVLDVDGVVARADNTLDAS